MWTTLKNIGTWIWTNLFSKNAILAICAGAVLLFTVKTCGNSKQLATYDTQLAAWQKQVKNDLVVATKDSTRIDSLQKQNAVLQKQRDSLGTVGSKLATDANTKAQKLDSVLTILNVPKVADSTCAQELRMLNQYKSAYDSLGIAYQLTVKQDKTDSTMSVNNAKSVILVMTVNDSLRAALLHVPVYKQEKFLNFIPLPSRTASLGVGAILGAAAILAIEHIK